jgi:hypothetical protein
MAKSRGSDQRYKDIVVTYTCTICLTTDQVSVAQMPPFADEANWTRYVDAAARSHHVSREGGSNHRILLTLPKGYKRTVNHGK